MLRTITDSLRSCFCFLIFCLTLILTSLTRCLLDFTKVEIIIGKHLIQRRNNEAWVGMNLQPRNHSHCKNDAQNQCATTLTYIRHSA